MGRTSDPASTGSAALSLIELRRHLLRRAGALTVRAKALRTRGDIYSAARFEEQAARLSEIARQMEPAPPTDP